MPMRRLSRNGEKAQKSGEILCTDFERGAGKSSARARSWKRRTQTRGACRGLVRFSPTRQKLVHCIKGSRRYKADPSGVRAMCAYLILRDKVIKPLLAGVVRPFGRAPKVQAPVDQHYVRLREELNRTFETIGLAAA